MRMSTCRDNFTGIFSSPFRIAQSAESKDPGWTDDNELGYTISRKEVHVYAILCWL